MAFMRDIFSGIRGAIALIIVIAAFFIGWIAGDRDDARSGARSNQVRENSNEYSFINPLLFVDNSNVLFDDYLSLEEKAGKYIEEKVKSGDARGASIYYRDLNSGKWAGVNEKEKYIPSSMLKVATLIAYLKMSREDPKILEEKVRYEPADFAGQYYKPSKLLPPGTYRVSTLLQETIVRSENTAVDVLDELHTREILGVYRDLNLPDPIVKQNEDSDFMSPEEYSSLYRVLYNSTYLPESYSESALKLLSLAEFDKGLVAGVPEGVTVAHKFGEHTKLVNLKVAERQLHDCGIVYYPEHPYFICVMTRGMDFAKLEEAVAGISRIVYTEIDGKYAKR
jgi:hypothetical protein